MAHALQTVGVKRGEINLLRIWTLKDERMQQGERKLPATRDFVNQAHRWEITPTFYSLREYKQVGFSGAEVSLN